MKRDLFTRLVVLATVLFVGIGIKATTFDFPKSDAFLSLVVSNEEYNKWLTGTANMSATTTMLYQSMKDDVDFIVFVLDESNTPTGLGYVGVSYGVKNEVQGIGKSIYQNSASYGSSGKLQSSIILAHRTCINSGPFLHEIMHQWANYAIPTIDMKGNSYSGHWGVMGGSCKGQLGGFNESELVHSTENPNLYTVPSFGVNANGGNGVPYTDLELYLMGMIDVNSVAPFSVFTQLDSARTVSGTCSLYTQTPPTVYTPEKLVSTLGARVPNSTNSQKNFNALFVVVSNAPITSTEQYNQQIANFCKQGSYSAYTHNFYTATRGIGTFSAQPASKMLKESSEVFVCNTPANADTQLKYGDEYTIQWTSSIAGNVRIDLYNSNGFVKTIASNVPANRGSYVWTIDELSSASSKTYSFKIISTSDDNKFTYSKGDFDVTEAYVTISGTVKDKLGNPMSGVYVSTGNIPMEKEFSRITLPSLYVVEKYNSYTIFSFTSQNTTLNRVDMYLTKKGNPGDLHIGVKDKNGTVIYDDVMPESMFTTNGVYTYEFDKPVSIVPGEQYTLYLNNPTVEYGVNCYYTEVNMQYVFSPDVYTGGGLYARTNEQGEYQLSVVRYWDGTIQPLVDGKYFNSRSYNSIESDLTSQDFVETDTPTSVKDIMGVVGDGKVTVFDVLGRMVMRDVDIHTAIDVLPQGIYVIDGKKYCITSSNRAFQLSN